MSKGPKRRIKAAMARVRGEIEAQTPNTRAARGMAYEGFQGGYLKALSDIMLVLNRVQPSTRQYWQDWE
jgi:hypothetical protein